MTPHKHADLLHAIAEGRKVEMRHSKDCPWYSPSYILRLLDDDAAGDGPTNYEFRVQPEDYKEAQYLRNLYRSGKHVYYRFLLSQGKAPHFERKHNV